VSSRRTFEHILPTDADELQRLTPFTFLFSKYISDKDILRFRCAYICGCTMFIVASLGLKTQIGPYRGLEALLLLNVGAVTLFILMNVLLSRNLRVLCKRETGPILLNLLYFTSFLFCNGVIAASLFDVAILSTTGNVLMEALTIIGNNFKLASEPLTLLANIVRPTFYVWKYSVLLLIYWFLISELKSVRAWKNWRRDCQDWLFLATHYYAAANYPKVSECLGIALRKADQDLVGDSYFLLAGFASLETANTVVSHDYLNKVPVPVAGFVGQPALFWCAFYAAVSVQCSHPGHALAAL
jgi:hypothetical protein